MKQTLGSSILTVVLLFTAPNMTAEEAEFGVTSITLFETARLSAVCSEHLGRAPEPCEVEFEFSDSQGRGLKKVVMTIAPGASGFLDLRGSEAGARGSAVEIQPCIKVLRGGLIVSFQTFDNFLLRTNLLVNWSDRSVPRSGEADFGLAGITAFDTARLSTFCPSDGPFEPCEITFIFHDARGRVVKQGTRILQPGTGGSLDLRLSELGVTSGRGELQPCVKITRGLVVGNFRVLDTFTGHTRVLVYPGAGLSVGTPVPH